jgi:hypothetical protein
MQPGGARTGILAATAVAALSAYAWLAAAGVGSGVERLLGVQTVGWLALGVAWRVSNDSLDTTRAAWLVAGAALAFRLCGLAATPGWEDDYFRHLWDGWMTWRTGSPYGVAPLAWFGAEGVPARMETVLDGVNHPEHATIYGPAAQVWAALAAGLAPGGLWVFKAGLVLAEGAGLWALWRLGGARALLFAGWCPLAVTEIAFAGHVDALVLAGLALALHARARGRLGAVGGWLALAVASKAYALLFAPFFLWRAGWRGVAWFGGTLAVWYAPWVVATTAAGRDAASVFGGAGVGAMAGSFEFNSTGYALLAAGVGDAAGRVLAGALLGVGLAGIWLWWASGSRTVGGGGESRAVQISNITQWVILRRWQGRDDGREGGGMEAGADVCLPGAAVVGWWALWSPVFHPWYALAALPFLALRPIGWGTGLLVALPLSYLHGLTLAVGAAATGDFRHPVWVRPAEVAGVALGELVAWWRRGWRRG